MYEFDFLRHLIAYNVAQKFLKDWYDKITQFLT